MLPQPPVLVEGWFPPSRENWEWLNYWWQLFPLFASVQWVTTFFPQGKTSLSNSRLNLPGKWAWMVMELPGMLTLLYCLLTIPGRVGLEPSGLPVGNWTMATLFCVHYIYRAVISPLLLTPSMSPIHVSVFGFAIAFQVTNGLCLGGWMGGYGPTTVDDWAGRLYMVEIGLVVWGWGLLANIFHEDDLRSIRRDALARQRAEGKADGIDKLYMLPKNALFRYVLFPHYLCEWIEWAGFYMIGGPRCLPARSFLLNEIAAMTPRAVNGWHWYVDKFGRKAIGSRKAIIPGLL